MSKLKVGIIGGTGMSVKDLFHFLKIILGSRLFQLLPVKIQPEKLTLMQ
jgi:hypothetical protein